MSGKWEEGWKSVEMTKEQQRTEKESWAVKGPESTGVCGEFCRVISEQNPGMTSGLGLCTDYR